MLGNATGMITALWDCILYLCSNQAWPPCIQYCFWPLEPDPRQLWPSVALAAGCSLLGSGLLPQLDVGPFIVIYRRLFILLTANCLYRQFS